MQRANVEGSYSGIGEDTGGGFARGWRDVNEAGRYGEATMCDWTDTVFAIAQLVGSCSISFLCMAGIGAMIYWFRRNSES